MRAAAQQEAQAAAQRLLHASIADAALRAAAGRHRSVSAVDRRPPSAGGRTASARSHAREGGPLLGGAVLQLSPSTTASTPDLRATPEVRSSRQHAAAAAEAMPEHPGLASSSVAERAAQLSENLWDAAGATSFAAGRALRERDRFLGTDSGSSGEPPAGTGPSSLSPTSPLTPVPSPGARTSSSVPSAPAPPPTPSPLPPPDTPSAPGSVVGSAAGSVSVMFSAASDVESEWGLDMRTPSASAETTIDASEQPSGRRRRDRTGLLHRLRREEDKGGHGTPDHIDFWMLEKELSSAQQALARIKADPELVAKLDLPGLAALRAEIVAVHSEALERIDDRRVHLHAQQAALREGPESGRCVACWARKADRLLLPCRHLCVCGVCLSSCSSLCPICRATVADSIEVFGVS